MILFALAGYLLSRFAGVDVALPVAVVLGFLVAPLVPAKTSCAIDAPGADRGDE